MKRPPKKLSNLILLALKDLEKVEKSKVYVVDMYTWHGFAPSDDKCQVCFAGSVMAKTHKTSRYSYKHPSEFSDSWKNAFYALNEVRHGYVSRALRFFGVKIKKTLVVPVCDYEEDKQHFKDDMRAIVKTLKRDGF